MKKKLPVLLLFLSLGLNAVLGALLLRQKAQEPDYMQDFYTNISDAASCTDRWQFSDDAHDSAGTMAAIHLYNAYWSAQWADADAWPHALSDEFFRLQNFVVCDPETVHPHTKQLTALLLGLGSQSYMAQNEAAAIKELREFIDMLMNEV